MHALHIERRRRPVAPRPRRRKWLLGLSFILAAAALVLVGSTLRWPSQLGQGTAPAPERAGAQPTPDRPQPTLSAGGYIIARNHTEVGSRITGRVVSLEVSEGDEVTPGRVIARLDDREINAEVAQAKANLAAAQSQLAELEAGSRPQEIAQARSQMQITGTEMESSLLSLRRTEYLVNEGVLARQTLDDARVNYQISQRKHQAAKESFDMIQAGPRVEEISFGRARVRQAQAQVAFAEAQLQHTVVRAPVSGTILRRYVSLGEMVTTGFTSDRGAKQALVSIADLSDLQVEVEITETQIGKVELGSPVIMIPDAFPDRQYKGVVEYVAPIGNRQRATVQVKIKPLNFDKHLRIEMGMKVLFYPAAETAPKGGGGHISSRAGRGGHVSVAVARPCRGVKFNGP